MADRFFSTSKHGRLLNVAAGVSRTLKIATFGSSLMTATNGFGSALAWALWKHHNANVIFYHRGVLTSTFDATVLPDPGQCYATAGGNSTHMVGPQKTQFLIDVAAGKTADLLFLDGALFNDNPSAQANLETAFARTMEIIETFFDPEGNNGIAAAVVGTNLVRSGMTTAWANMWRRQEAISGGRIRFIDGASLLLNRQHDTPTTWAWRNGQGSTTLEAYSSDGTHPSEPGARAYAPAIADFLRDFVPAKFPHAGGLLSADYDPAGNKWGNVLGLGGAMLGASGRFNSNTPNAGVPGLATSGYVGRWNVSTPNMEANITPTIGTGPNGERQLELALSGSVGGGNYFELSYIPAAANVNNGVATRKFMLGAEIEHVGVTGLTQTRVRQMGQASYWGTPVCNSQSGDNAQAMPELMTETWQYRTLYPVAYSGDNPAFYIMFMFRAATAAGTINIRNPWMHLVEE